MKLMIAAFATIALAIFSLSIPEASADGRMTGKGNCSGGYALTRGGQGCRHVQLGPVARLERHTLMT
jgi:hypothetical protein